MSNRQIYAILEKYLTKDYNTWPEYEVIGLDHESYLVLYLADASELEEGDEEGISLRRAELVLRPGTPDHVEKFEWFDRVGKIEDKEERSKQTFRYFDFENNVLNKNKDGVSIPIQLPKDLPKRVFVNGYEVSREYGGPEEGGWYYDQYHPVSSFLAIDEEHAQEIAEVLRAKAKEEKPEDNRWSVIGTPDLAVCIENHPALRSPLSRPYYE